MTKTKLLATGAAALAAALAGQAQAHAHLVKANPAAGAAVAAPAALDLQFSERLEPKFSTLQLTMAGKAVPTKVEVKDKALHATPAAPLAAGAYKVNWKVVSADGHKVGGGYDFTVK